MIKKEVLSTLENKITLFKHLGIEFIEVSATKIHLKVDLQKNLNHKGTAFGGSLYTAAVVAAYALVLTGLKEFKIDTENIVIAKGSIEYRRPVEDDFEVVCELGTLDEAENFYEELRKNGRAKKELHSYINSSGGSCRAEFSGTFVVKLG